MCVAEKIEKVLGVDSNQAYFVFCQFLAILCGFILKCLLPPSASRSKQRHFFEFAIGILILYVGYGPDIVHLFVQAVPVYLMLVFLPPSIAQYGILIFSMAYLSAVHISQIITHRYSSVDITSPLMVQTQKLSSLAFNYNDGIKLSAGIPVARERHKLHAIRQRPRLLQLGGYLFCFHNCMVGPSMFFADYVRFIEGREVDGITDPIQKERLAESIDEVRAAKSEFIKQLKLLLIHTFLTIWAFTNFSADHFISERFARKNFLHKFIYLYVGCFALRQKFYFAWTISCLANLAAGYGFSGFNALGKPEYGLATNIYLFPIELGTSTKTVLDAWNTATTRWLRECIYDRAPKRYAVWMVFIASALWHGFQPGYYLAFTTAALVTVAGRYCRRYLRPYFLGSPAQHFLYDVITHIAALFCVDYLGVAFLLQKTGKVLHFWRQMRYLGHIGPILLIVFLPVVCGKPHIGRIVRPVANGIHNPVCVPPPAEENHNQLFAPQENSPVGDKKSQ
ncbi:unnamed protein product [Calicophoron daubneyi]|uniref:Uncharacterized protein n=1 Tax=Calicophoron daubneyi TaxID=300641 RepID=A0AAV2TT58_CALDB